MRRAITVDQRFRGESWSNLEDVEENRKCFVEEGAGTWVFKMRMWVRDPRGRRWPRGTSHPGRSGSDRKVLQVKQEVLFEAIIIKGLACLAREMISVSTGNGRVWTREGFLDPGEHPVGSGTRRREMETRVMSPCGGQRPQARPTTNGMKRDGWGRCYVWGKDLCTLT